MGWMDSRFIGDIPLALYIDIIQRTRFALFSSSSLSPSMCFSAISWRPSILMVLMELSIVEVAEMRPCVAEFHVAWLLLRLRATYLLTREHTVIKG